MVRPYIKRGEREKEGRERRREGGKREGVREGEEKEGGKETIEGGREGKGRGK
jgi:hypothetical protein